MGADMKTPCLHSRLASGQQGTPAHKPKRLLTDVSTNCLSALYDVVYSWVESPALRVYSQDCRAELGASRVAGEGTEKLLRYHRLRVPNNVLAEFPLECFMDHLFGLASSRVLSAVSAEADRIFTVTHRDLNTIKLDVDAEVAQVAERLRRVFAFIPRVKRRSPEEDEERLAYVSLPLSRRNTIS